MRKSNWRFAGNFAAFENGEQLHRCRIGIPGIFLDLPLEHFWGNEVLTES
jgi:hypothetical protein